MKSERMKNIADVLEEMDALIDTHFDEFSETKSSLFLKKVFANQNVIDTGLFKKTWRTLNCTPKTVKMILEIQENLLCVGKRENHYREEDGGHMLAQQDSSGIECQACHQLLHES